MTSERFLVPLGGVLILTTAITTVAISHHTRRSTMPQDTRLQIPYCAGALEMHGRLTPGPAGVDLRVRGRALWKLAEFESQKLEGGALINRTTYERGLLASSPRDCLRLYASISDRLDLKAAVLVARREIEGI